MTENEREKWLEAARKASTEYQELAKVEAQKAKEQAILLASRQLSDFLESADGEAALELLKATGKKITLERHNLSGPFKPQVIYEEKEIVIMNGTFEPGVLTEPFELRGIVEVNRSLQQRRYTYTNFSTEKYKSITVEEGVREITDHGTIQPAEIVPYIRGKLNEIAGDVK
jgi:hypothetical protein